LIRHTWSVNVETQGRRGSQAPHSNRAGIVNSPQFQRRVDAALQPYLGADRIVAGARVTSGRYPRTTRLIAALLASAVSFWAQAVSHGWLHETHNLFLWVFVVPSAAVVVPGAIADRMHRRMLIAVTGHQLICCRLSTYRQRPTRLVFAVPLGGARLSRYRVGWRATAVSYERPGRTPLVLTAYSHCRGDLAEVIETAHAAGAVVETSPERPGSRPLASAQMDRISSERVILTGP
jgi:hypothetical protein